MRSIFRRVAARARQAKIGHQAAVGASYGFYAGVKPLRPLIKVHPVTGRPALYIGRHAYGIPGMSDEESEQLLADLVDFACRPPRPYKHNRRVGDTVIWDNRCVMHRARPCDRSEPRVLQHTRVAGEPETELAAGMTPQAAAVTLARPSIVDDVVLEGEAVLRHHQPVARACLVGVPVLVAGVARP